MLICFFYSTVRPQKVSLPCPPSTRPRLVPADVAPAQSFPGRHGLVHHLVRRLRCRPERGLDRLFPSHARRRARCRHRVSLLLEATVTSPHRMADTVCSGAAAAGRTGHPRLVVPARSAENDRVRRLFRGGAARRRRRRRPRWRVRYRLRSASGHTEPNPLSRRAG